MSLEDKLKLQDAENAKAILAEGCARRDRDIADLKNTIAGMSAELSDRAAKIERLEVRITELMQDLLSQESAFISTVHVLTGEADALRRHNNDLQASSSKLIEEKRAAVARAAHLQGYVEAYRSVLQALDDDKPVTNIFGDRKASPDDIAIIDKIKAFAGDDDFEIVTQELAPGVVEVSVVKGGKN